MFTGVVLAAWMVVGQAGQPPSNYEHLKNLEWMVGTWKTEAASETDMSPLVKKGDKFVVTLSSDWTLNKNVMESTMTVQLKSTGITLMMVRILRGWDAAEKKVRIASFDSVGKIGHGTLTQVGDEWHATNHLVGASGKKEVSTMVFSNITSDTLKARQVNRTADGKDLPDTPVWTVKRVK